MSSNLPEIISLTTLCTAGCSHCPHSDSKLQKLFLTPSATTRIANNSSRQLVILTGGEPLLHPKINEILTNLSRGPTPFRLATGGFVDFSPWVDQFKSLCKQALQGISIGTDVISHRVSGPKWVDTWSSNILMLQEYAIPYSLTMTIDPWLEFKWLDIWNWEGFQQERPHFIYLRFSNIKNKDQWVEKIRKKFGAIPIIEDNLSLLNPENH